MDENAAKWYKTYKLMHGVGTWSEFIAAVEQQFGSYEYQEGTIEEYISTFVDLQYQLTMHNTSMDQVYFVTQIIKGLKPDLRAGVQSKVPKTMQKAIMLA